MQEAPPILHQCPDCIKFAGVHIAESDFPRHSHEVVEVIYQRTGYIQTVQEDDIFAMSPGCVLIHPAGTTHCDIASMPYSLFYIMLRVPAAWVMQWPRICRDDADQNLARICDSIVKEFWKKGEGESFDLIQLLAGELDMRLRRQLTVQHKQSPDEELANEVERLLCEQFRERSDFAKLARQIGVSRSTLYARYAAARAGATPAEYLRQTRLHFALGLLSHTTQTLEAIAEQSGYYSASHLSRHVKEMTGRSPGAHRL